MLVANGTYALTAGNYVECNCGQQISSKLIIPFVQCSFLAFYLFRTITPSFTYSLYCTPYELEQRMKHEREEMDSVVMLHRAEMDIKLREERASMDRALKEEPDKMDSKHHASTGHALRQKNIVQWLSNSAETSS